MNTHTQLKQYAAIESKKEMPLLSNANKGYVCEYSYFNWSLMGATVAVLIVLFSCSAKELYSILTVDDSDKIEINLSIFFSIGTLIFPINITEIALNIYIMTIYLENLNDIRILQQTLGRIEYYKQDINELYNSVSLHLAIKLIGGAVMPLLTFVIAGVIGIMLSIKSSNKFVFLPKYCACCNSFKESKILNGLLYFFVFANFFTSISIEGMNVVPTFLLLLITPLQTLTIMVFCLSIFITVVLFLALIYIRAFRSSDKCSLIKLLITFILLLVATAALMSIYIKTLSTATQAENSTLIFTQLVSFIPSILSLLCGYRVKKKLYESGTSDTRAEYTQVPDPHTSGTNTN